MIGITWRRCVGGAAILLALAFAAPPPARGQDKEADRPADQAAVKARTQALLKALGQGDAKELAAFWTPTGEYHREELTIRGRANIEKAYAEALKDKKPRQIEAQADTVRFLSDDTAIHDGTFVGKQANPAEQSRSHFSALYVRVKGQ